MKKDTVVSIDEPETTRDALTEVLREGAQKLIAEAVQVELEELLENIVMANGRADHATPPHCAMQLGSMLNL